MPLPFIPLVVAVTEHLLTPPPILTAMRSLPFKEHRSEEMHPYFRDLLASLLIAIQPRRMSPLLIYCPLSVGLIVSKTSSPNRSYPATYERLASH